MKEAIFFLLILCGIAWAEDRHFDSEEAASGNTAAAIRQAVTPSSTSYTIHQVAAVDALIARVERSSSLTERQAEAYADLYGLTEKDLNSKVNIFIAN